MSERLMRSISFLLLAFLLIGVSEGAIESSDTKIKIEETTYVYSKDIGQAKNVPIIKIDFNNAFLDPFNNCLATADRIWQVSDSNPSHVIYDGPQTEPFSDQVLEEGYLLKIRSIKSYGDKSDIFIELNKNKMVVDFAVVTISNLGKNSFIYSKDIKDAKDVELIKIDFQNAFRGADQDLATIDSIWQASESDPYLVIKSSSDELIMTTGTPLQLAEGYELAIKAVSIDGNKLHLELSKNGYAVHSGVISLPMIKKDTFTYIKDIGDAKDIDLIKVHFKNAFRGADQDLVTIDSIWQASESDPSFVIYDSSDEMIITSGTPLRLEEGYELVIKSIDIDGNKAFLELSKDGETVDSFLAVPPVEMDATYAYTKDIGLADDIEFIVVHFKNVFRGADQDLATIDSIWQASEGDPSLVINDSSDEIIITSGNPLRLEEGYELVIKSIDIDGNKAYLELSKNGEPIDGSVIIVQIYDGQNIFSYSKDIGDAKDIDLIKVHFKNAFRGADQDLATIDSIWQASESDPSFVIRNSSDKIIITSGTPLRLEEGYELRVESIDIDGNKVYIQLIKEGEVVQSNIIMPMNQMHPKIEESTYAYTKDIGEANDIELIKVHVKTAIRGVDQDLATIDSIWQASESDQSFVIKNNSDEIIITSVTPLRLEEGYELVIKSIDIDGNKVYFELNKDGIVVDSAVIIPSFSDAEESKNEKFSDGKKLFQASEIMTMIKGGKPIEYNGIIIEGDLNLSAIKMETVPVKRSALEMSVLGLGKKAVFIKAPISITNSEIQGTVDFKNAVFRDAVDFTGTNFSSSASFEGSRFRSHALFSRSSFNHSAGFEGAKFLDGANFQDTHLKSYGEFTGANFGSYALFEGTIFGNDAYFWGTQFIGDANFQGVQFSRDAYFSGSRFEKDADFSGSYFNDVAYFRDSEFNGTADFSGSQFNKEGFFEGTNFNKIINIISAKYSKLYLRWSNIKSFKYDETAYQLLLKNYKDLGLFMDADNCYYQYRMELLTRPLIGINLFENILRKIVDFFSFVFYGFGVKPLYPLAWSIIFIVLFGLFWRGVSQKDERKFFDEYSLYNSSNFAEKFQGSSWKIALFDALNALGFSSTVFLSGTKLFVEAPTLPQINGRSQTTAKVVFVLERITGALLSILFFIAVSNVIIR